MEHSFQNLQSSQKIAQFFRDNLKFENFSSSSENQHSGYFRYRFLYEFGMLITSQAQIDCIFNVLLDEIIELTRAERCLLLLFDNHGKTLYQIGRNLRSKDLQAPDFKISWAIIRKTRDTHVPIFLKNVKESGEFRTSKRVLPIKILSVISMPIFHEHQCIGVLYADNRAVQGIFQKQVIELFQQFSELIFCPLAAALQKKLLENHFTDLRSDFQIREKYQSIIGTSAQIEEVVKFIDQVADTAATVLIEGESGTGKELVAKALHENSRRRSKPFVTLNCGALAETLLESELFGYVKGAFTGATRDRKGWFETADGGTIFFDEISEMSPALQVKLLRILQSREFSPVGSSEIKTCDVRIIAATNKHLEDLIKDGKFRSDLYYRLNILYLYVPPLRERREDIPLLAAFYLLHFGKQQGKEALTLGPCVKEILLNYDFPGNIRELENAMQRVAVLLAPGQQAQLQHLPEAFRSLMSPVHTNSYLTFADAKRTVMERFEKNYIERTLIETRGVVTRAARMAGMDAKNFFQKMAKYEIAASSYRRIEQ